MSYIKGGGSRSTYYGRLRPDRPAYTVSTCFYRPGNGCNMHYSQDRVITEREAARLQSFPDSFKFFGAHTSIAKQIGNAVPPLFAYQIALCLGSAGTYIDLFCGAGGLSLGFKWAGWRDLLANDVEQSFLETYSRNLSTELVPGDIRLESVASAILGIAREKRKSEPGVPFWVLGGPPCQGFSTAGNRRSRHDERNWLFKNYREIVKALEPDGFLFENVPGLLNMEGGNVFREVRDALASVSEQVLVWRIDAASYGIPQRRQRVFLIGVPDSRRKVTPPEPICGEKGPTLLGFRQPLLTVEEALRDLPPVGPGEDGSHKDYLFPPQTPYQRFMRGLIGAQEYLTEMRAERAHTALEPCG